MRNNFTALALVTLCGLLGACGGGGSASTAAGPPLAVSTSSLPGATVGIPVSETLAASGGSPPYHWSLQTGALPAGVVLGLGGTMSGTPTTAGNATFTVLVTDSATPARSAAKPLTLAVAPAPLLVTSTGLPQATANAPYTTSLTASGGSAPYRWSVASDSLPPGLTLSPAGVLSGTPLAGETATLTLQVLDSGSPAQVASHVLTLTISVAALAIGSPTLAGAAVNAPYSTALAATGGAGAYQWSLASGTLPAGVTLAGNGLLAGTPSAPGIATFAVTVTDAGNPVQTATQSYNLLVAATGTAVQVALAATPSTISVGSSYAGLSYEKSKLSTALFSPSNATLIGLFRGLGPSLLRIGGNSVDDTLWNAAGSGTTSKQVSPADIDRLSGFLKATGWQVLYGIEFLNEQASPVTTADPSLVAQEAVYAMQSLGDSLYGFELGNEPDLYHDKITGFDYATFQAQWQVYRAAIVSAVDAAKTAGTLPQSATPRFTGPAAAYDQAGFVAPFAQSEASDIFLLTRHYYVANGQNATSTMTLLLTPDPALAPDLAAIQSSATTNHIGAGYRMSEANSFYNGGAPGVSDGFGTALWAINFLYTNAWAGSAGVNFHGGGSGPGYTPIADNGVAAIEARPEYYGIYLYALAATGQRVATTSTPATSNLYAYAVAGSGTTNVMLVNTSGTLSENVVVQFSSAATSASFVTLTGPSLGSTSGQLLNGAAIQPDGTWPAPVPPTRAIAGGSRQGPGPAGSAILLLAK